MWLACRGTCIDIVTVPPIVCIYIYIYICAVNDLGGTMDGTGHGKKLADDVVDIIRSRGGTAVANYGQCR